MDVISIGLANKASVVEKEMRNKTLAVDVEGKYASAKERIDYLEDTFGGIFEKANELILQDAVNIMKAHARLNTVAHSMRYKMHNMIFDDLLDVRGIDDSLSEDYTHSSFDGSIAPSANEMTDILKRSSQATIVTVGEIVEAAPENAVFSVEEEATKITSIVPNLSGDNIPSPYVVVASSVYNISFKGFNAFNDEKNDTSSRWMTRSGVTNGWLSIDLGEQKKVNGYTISQIETTSMMDNSSMPKSWILHASNNGADWTAIDIVEGESLWNSMESRIFTLNKTVNYRYYKIEVIENNGNSSFLSIPNFKLLNIVRSKDEVSGYYYISRDNGNTWQAITPNSLFYFDPKISEAGTQIRLKVILPSGIRLLNYGLTWS